MRSAGLGAHGADICVICAERSLRSAEKASVARATRCGYDSSTTGGWLSCYLLQRGGAARYSLCRKRGVGSVGERVPPSLSRVDSPIRSLST